MGFDVRGIDHLHRRGAAAPGKCTEQSLPHAAFRPANKAIVDRRRWSVYRRTIAPPAAALDDKQDAADYAPIIHTRLATDVRRQKRLYRAPLFIAQPKKVGSHGSPRHSSGATAIRENRPQPDPPAGRPHPPLRFTPPDRGIPDAWRDRLRRRAARHDLEPAAAHLVQHAFDELRSDAAPARRDRRLGVRQRHHIAGEAVSHERGDAAGVELEAGQRGIVADLGRACE